MLNSNKKYAIVAVVAASAVIVATIGLGIAVAHKYASTSQIQGSANLAAVIEQFIKENRKVTFESASKVVEASRAGTILTDGRFTVMQGYLVYVFRVIDRANGELYTMVIDAGNGSVLYTSEPVTFRSTRYADANIAVSMSSAASNAVKEVANATVESGRLRIGSDGNALYTFIVRDGEGKLYKISVSAGDGNIMDVVEVDSKKDSKKDWKGYWYGHDGYHGYDYGYKHKWKH
ncbi:hypothetical protein HRbin04_00948 [archaeon HR04]|nr:hypothetical protein HRbin04_00948 [archaeon HR04]